MLNPGVLYTGNDIVPEQYAHIHRSKLRNQRALNTFSLSRQNKESGYLDVKLEDIHNDERDESGPFCPFFAEENGETENSPFVLRPI
jgi:hypothetical protein